MNTNKITGPYLTVLKKWKDFDGRATRKELWMFALCNFLISLALSIVGAMLDPANILLLIYCLIILIPSIAVSVRRLHDIGRCGWWLFLSFIPFVGSIILLIFYVLDSQEGSNKYGANPKGID